MTSPHANGRMLITKQLAAGSGRITVEGPVAPQHIADLDIDRKLDCFRPAQRQQEALVDIAGLENGWVVLAHQDGTIVGYVTFHPPEEFERWGRAHIKEIIELGAIEVAPGYRHCGLGKALMDVAFTDPIKDNYIIISTEYYWHWDLEGTRLNIWEYQEVMTKLMESVGMLRQETDEQEITAHPANMLMVRVGANVGEKARTDFAALLFMRRKGRED